MKKLPLPSFTRLAIVDSAPRDYGDLLAAAGTPGVSIHFLFSGSDAMPFARRWPALWVINSRLCDMSGFELANKVRSLRPSTTIFIIGDQYNLADELRTMTLGLAKYLCKPLEPSWVLPQERAMCIPLPALQEARSASDSVFFATVHPAKVAAGDRVVLPFGSSPQRRPAA